MEFVELCGSQRLALRGRCAKVALNADNSGGSTGNIHRNKLDKCRAESILSFGFVQHAVTTTERVPWRPRIASLCGAIARPFSSNSDRRRIDCEASESSRGPWTKQSLATAHEELTRLCGGKALGEEIVRSA